VQSISYAIDGGNWIANAPFSIPTHGSHVITFRSIDWCGNVEPNRTITLFVDIRNATSSISYTLVYSPNFVVASTTFTITADDAGGSGVQTISYAIDGGNWIANAPFSLATHGSHAITFRSIDWCGNVEPNRTITVFVDIQNATSSLSFTRYMDQTT